MTKIGKKTEKRKQSCYIVGFIPNFCNIFFLHFFDEIFVEVKYLYYICNNKRDKSNINILQL